MSKCVSSDGEYSEHVPGAGPERFHCQRCFVFDEDAALDRIAKLEARLRRNEVTVSVDDKAIMGAVKQHLAGFKAELEAAKGGPVRILPAELATNGEFVLSWHPLDDHGDPVEIPLGEPWLLPGTDVKVGEFRLSTREVPPAGPTVTVDKSVPDLYDPDPEVLVDSEWEFPDGEVSGG